jgi:hypothetical protein
MITRAEHDRHFAELRERFAYQFAGPNSGFSIIPGWLPLLEAACDAIHAVLLPSERPHFWYVEIRERLGGLSIQTNVSTRLDFSGLIRTELGYVYIPENTQRVSLSTKVMPILRAIEQESVNICCFCGADGELRNNGDNVLALCARHAPYTYRHLDLAFELLTDPALDLVPPSLDQVINTLRRSGDRLREAGASRLGLLPPDATDVIWRLVLSETRDQMASETKRIVESLLRWPFDVVCEPPAGDRTPQEGDVIWILGDHT